MRRLGLVGAWWAATLGAGCDVEPTSDEPRLRSAALQCGDGIVDPGEACDLGSGNQVGTGCTERCEVPSCGDALVSPHEQCDDGNTRDGDGCSALCRDEAEPLWSAAYDLAGAYGETLHAVAVDHDGIYAVGRVSSSWSSGTPVVMRLDWGGRLSWIDEPEAGPTAQAGAFDVIVHEGDAVVVGTVADDSGVLLGWAWRYGADGDLRWSKPLVGPPSEATAIAADGDAAMVAGTVVRDGKEDAWIGRLSLHDGRLVQWDPIEGAERETVSDLAIVDEETIVLAGSKGSLMGARGWVAGVDRHGALRWEQLVGNETGAAAEALAVSDDAVYVTGWLGGDFHETPHGQRRDYDVWLGRYSLHGQPIWARTYDGFDHMPDYGEGLTVLDDGTVVVAGSVQTRPLLVSESWDRDAWLGAWDESGELLWTQTQDGPVHRADGARALLETPRGTLLSVGDASVSFEGANAWVAELSPTGVTPASEPDLRGSSELTGRTDLVSTASRLPAEPEVGPQRDVEPGRHRATVYLDFDGGELRPGDRGPLGEVSCIDGPLTYPGFGGDEQQAAAIAQVAGEALRPYGVHVVWEERPPEHLPYTTIMLGGNSAQLGLSENAAGYACEVDCGDLDTREVAFTFDSYGADVTGTNVVHEAAHTWGLDHVAESGRVMHPFSHGGKPSWTAQCIPVSEKTNQAYCMSEHEALCPPGRQNSHAELLAIFGEGGPDTEAPFAEILTPAEGSRILPGRALTVEVQVEDDFGDPGWKLVVPGLGWEQVAWDRQTEFSVVLPTGRHTLELHAIDHDRNETIVRRTVVVGTAKLELAPSVALADPVSVGPSPPEASGCSVTGPGKSRLSSILLALLWLLGRTCRHDNARRACLRSHPCRSSSRRTMKRPRSARSFVGPWPCARRERK